jgi:hypothetical protein
MAVAAGKIGFETRISAVEHLDELRTRLIVSLVAVGVAFGICVWQNHALLLSSIGHWLAKPRSRCGQGAGRLVRRMRSSRTPARSRQSCG